jgi:hypothetical protein
MFAGVAYDPQPEQAEGGHENDQVEDNVPEAREVE